MAAISTLSALTNDSTLTSGASISHTEHNTHRTNYRNLINNLLTVAQDLEDNYASNSAPTDKPEGKLWADTTSDPAIIKYYHDGSSNTSTLQADHGAYSGTPSTTGAHISIAASTFTDNNTAGSGTATAWVGNSFAQPTLAATNASVTTTNAATVYIANAPTAGTNQTLTNAYALWVDAGTVQFDGALNVGGALAVTGATTFSGDLDLNGNNLTDTGVIFLKEQAEADADLAGYGQLWVDTATPNVLMFTDDAGTDFTIAHNATTTLSSLVTVGALNSGSITSGFGNIDIGSSNLTATGTVSLGATSFNDNNITNVGNIALDSISSDAGTTITVTLGSDAGDDFIVGSNYLVVEGDSGNVGIGCTPSTLLDLESTSTVQIDMNCTGGSGRQWTLQSRSDTGNFQINDDTAGQNRLAIDSSGNVGIGVTPSAKFHAYHTTNAQQVATIQHTGATSPNGIYMYFSGGAPDDNTNYFLKCEDNASGGTARAYIMSDGDLQNHDNSYGAISDERLKQDIVDANSQWEDIKALKVRNYRFKSDVEADENANPHIGVIAQELMQTSPKLVKHNEERDEYSVEYSVLYMKAVKALQEALFEIDSLKERVSALEGA